MSKMSTTSVTASDTTIASIDNNLLASVAGVVKPGPNGEGCTGPGCGGPFPRPRPQPFPFPRPGGPIVDPAPDLTGGLNR